MIFLAFRGLLNIAEHQAFSCLSEICDKFASLKIDYPGSGNKSEFAYDGSDRCVKNIETVSSTVTSARQFIWSDDSRRDERDSFGSVVKQFFAYGQKMSSGNYFYTLDQLMSTREFTDATGNIVGQFNYDVYGRISQVKGTSSPDFLYSGYFYHAQSSLSLTQARAYSGACGRWLSRDPLPYEINPYSYVSNRPVSYRDPKGLKAKKCTQELANEMMDRVEFWNHSKFSNELVLCLIWKETNFDPSFYAPSTGATGLMQMTPGALKDVNDRQSNFHFESSHMYDVGSNLHAGTMYLDIRLKVFHGDIPTTLDHFGTGYPYSVNILKCEKCLKKQKEDAKKNKVCPNPCDCLNKIHT